VYKSLPELIKRVSKEEGLRGMWTGCGVNAMRAVFMNVADLAVTDVARGVWVCLRVWVHGWVWAGCCDARAHTRMPAHARVLQQRLSSKAHTQKQHARAHTHTQRGAAAASERRG